MDFMENNIVQDLYYRDLKFFPFFYNINKKEMYFMENNIVQDQCYRYLKFCPVVYNNDIVLATYNTKHIKVHLE